jgi:hypothetical protein
MWLESVGVLSFSSPNCQEEGVSGGAKGPSLPAALRGLDAPELETKIGQMVQGGPKGSRRVLEGFSKELGWNGLAIFHHLSSSFGLHDMGLPHWNSPCPASSHGVLQRHCHGHLGRG